MNIKILDSWLRDYLKTKATAQDIAKAMSLTSISIERVEPYGTDFIYDIEITTNRSDLLSVVSLAQEAAAVLPQMGFEAEFVPPELLQPPAPADALPLTIISDKSLVTRVCAAVMEVEVKKSPSHIAERLETSDIRSLNNIIDITNYVMRTIGHPTHVFDYDRLLNHTINIRKSQKGETVTTLDGKQYVLPGEDIVADDGNGTIIDLLGIMGLENSVVADDTKRIVFFIDTVNRHAIRKTSMKLGIRTEAAQMNEKGIDPELAYDALLLGISLFTSIAKGRLVAPIIDIYDEPYKQKTVSVTEKKLQQTMGVAISISEAAAILTKLGFATTVDNDSLSATVPSIRAEDIAIPEDLIEEVARVYGYHNLPSVLPPVTVSEVTPFGTTPFYWEDRIKQACKYWGFTEVYTYPMVSEQMYEGPTEEAVTLANPLGEDFVYMRRTLVPSLLKVVEDNRQTPDLSIFEIANVYEKNTASLPTERKMFAGVIKRNRADFFSVKGMLEQLATDVGIRTISFVPLGSMLETGIHINNNPVGTVEMLDESTINFEIDFEKLIASATVHKTFKALAKYPPVFEDISVIVDEEVLSGDIITAIKEQDSLIKEVTIFDRYQNSRTFSIMYQDETKNLTSDEISSLREKIYTTLKTKFKAEIK